MQNASIFPPVDSEVSIKEYFRQSHSLLDSQLESYICLSPLLRWPKYLQLNQFPNFLGKDPPEDPLIVDITDKQIKLLVEQGYPIDRMNNLTWKEVISDLGFKDVYYLYHALNNMFFYKQLSDETLKQDCLNLHRYLVENNINFPDEGGIPDFYKPLFIESFKLFKYETLSATDFFGDDLENFSIDDMLRNFKVNKKLNLQFYVASLFTEDLSMSYTGPMDCYFSILTASKKRIERILEKYNFEGFYADESTTCRWGLGD